MHTCSILPFYTGVRVILLNCLSEFGVQVLRQANDKGMTEAGWAWVVTDGMTASVCISVCYSPCMK